MEIRKTFKFEAAHIVREAWSRRCSHNTHGHSYIVEVFFGQVEKLSMQNGGMIIDFGLIKKYGNDFIDSFDHSLMLWDVDIDKEFINFAKQNFERVVITSFPTSAEVQAAMFYIYFNKLVRWMKNDKLCNPDVYVSRVIVHETSTGKAEYNFDDYQRKLIDIDLKNIYFSPNIESEWKEPDILKKVISE